MSRVSDQILRRYMQSLGQDARILKFARMLPPMDQALKDEHHKAVRNVFVAYADRMGISVASAAKQIGISPSVLSQWSRGQYNGDNDRITRAVNRWIERDARARDARVELPYVPTQVAEDMRLIARLAYEHRCMAAIVCPAGSGKTKVLQLLAEDMSGWYIYCDEDMSPTSFLEQLCQAVGVPPLNKRSLARMQEEIVQKIRGSGRPILLDECHRLRRDVFGRIRSIHDRSECPVVMAGTAEILARIDDRSNGRGQLHSRCIMYNAMEHVTDVETPEGSRRGRPLFTREEIRRLFEHMPVKLSDGAFEMIWAIACLPGYGCLRTVKRVLDLAYRKWADETIGRDEIATVLSLFFGLKGKHIVQLAQRHSEVHRREAAA